MSFESKQSISFFLDCLIMRMKLLVCLQRRSVSDYKLEKCNTYEDLTLQQHRCETLKSRVI